MPRPRKLVWKEIRYGRKYRDISFPKPQPTKKKARKNRRNNTSGGQGGTTPSAAGGNEKVVEQPAPDLKGRAHGERRGTRMSRKKLCMGLVEASHLMEKCNDDCYAQIKQDRWDAGLNMNELRIQDALSSHCRYATRSHVGTRSLLIMMINQSRESAQRRLRCSCGIRQGEAPLEPSILCASGRQRYIVHTCMHCVDSP
ncbi:hypothetical protein PSENEW3_00001582 [Picochlorum sp. SENEW3]|nr:hypothetical protein PSENEW3_00001582 [Picochlorum sp. SENEW3]